MKTNTYITSLISLCLVIFLTSNGIASPGIKSISDNPEKTMNKSASNENSRTLKATATSNPENEFGYLRFDVNKYIDDDEAAELNDSEFDYLRFDVKDYSFKSETEEIELPAENEFEYLRFDVNKYINSGDNTIDDLPITK
jgi:hypothetical protein